MRSLAVALALATAAGAVAPAQPIDRRTLATVTTRSSGPSTPAPRCRSATGELAFTVDATGLQTFAEAYDETIPLGTLSQWGWHTDAVVVPASS